MKKKCIRLLVCAAIAALVFTASAVPALAAANVAGAIEQTWNTAKSQIQSVVNNVVFPVVDMILAILFACLIFTLTAPLYIWTIL